MLFLAIGYRIVFFFGLKRVQRPSPWVLFGGSRKIRPTDYFFVVEVSTLTIGSVVSTGQVHRWYWIMCTVSDVIG